MRILAIETSTEFCSVALSDQGRVYELSKKVNQSHSEHLMPMIQQLLSEHGYLLTQLDGIAFGKGPGSFTGVRIACCITQGLALGADLPVYGICTLEALAQQSEQEKVIAALDARMGEVYIAAYQNTTSHNLQEIMSPTLCQPDAISFPHKGDWFGVGSGFEVYSELLQHALTKKLVQWDRGLIPTAKAVVKLALPKFIDHQGMDAALALPMYLRNKVALKISERQKA